MILVYILSGVILGVSLILQSHPSFDVIRFAGVKPDLIFVAIVYFSYTFGSFYGEVGAFIGGLFQDSISNSPLGFLTLPKVIVAFAVGFFGRGMFQGGALMVMVLMLVASIVKGGLTFVVALTFHEAAAGDILGVILPESLYNAMIAMPLFYIFDKIFEFELSRERR